MKIKLFFLLIILFVITGCAYMYSPVQVSKINFNFNENMDTVQKIAVIYSKSNVFKEAGNKRLQNKAYKKKIYPLALKVVNNTDKDINFDSLKIEVFNDFSATDLVSLKKGYRILKQKSWGYLFYSFGGILSFGFSSATGLQMTTIYPIIIFPAISATNISIATISNQKLKNDMNLNVLYGKNIPANSELNGIIFIKTNEIQDIKIRINEK